MVICGWGCGRVGLQKSTGKQRVHGIVCYFTCGNDFICIHTHTYILIYMLKFITFQYVQFIGYQLHLNKAILKSREGNKDNIS